MSSQWDKPPPGYEPGQTRAPLVWNITVPFAIVALFFACLRFYVRVFLIRAIGKDDWLLLAAVVFLCGLVGGAVWGTVLGIGKHQYEVNQEIDPRIFLPVCHSCSYKLHPLIIKMWLIGVSPTWFLYTDIVRWY